MSQVEEEASNLTHVSPTSENEGTKQCLVMKVFEDEILGVVNESYPLAGTKRKHEDSFLDLIEKSLTSRRGSSASCLCEPVHLSCLMELDQDDGKEAKSLVSNAPMLVPLSTPPSNALEKPWIAKRIKTGNSRDENSVDGDSAQIDQILQRLNLVMSKSTKSQQSLQEWDRKNGLPASHCQTMVNSSRSREQLRSGMILQKWNGVPLLKLPGAQVKVTRRQFRGVKVAGLED